MVTVSRLSSSTGVLQPRRFIRRLGVAALAPILLAAGIWLGREPLLRGAADVWIISDPLVPADVVAVLGGGLERPFAAAELYKQGSVRKVLVSQAADGYLVKIGVMPAHTELSRTLLLKLGVPDYAIETFGLTNKNTRDEASALRYWADQHGASRIVIPTEIFGARRVRWIFSREFAGSAVKVDVRSFEPPEYTRAEWWKTEAGMIAFQNEVMKYLYYRLKY